jgi:hypothetical protein
MCKCFFIAASLQTFSYESVLFDNEKGKRGWLNLTVGLGLEGFGDFSEYVKDDKSLDINKVGEDIFTGKIKIEFHTEKQEGSEEFKKIGGGRETFM